MRRFSFLRTSITLILSFFISALVWAQPEGPAPGVDPLPSLTEMSTRDFLSIQGGSSSPSARVTLYRTEEDRLCAVVGVRRGPKSLNTGYFKFTRLLTVDGATQETDMRFAFPKKKTAGDKKLWIWQACEPSREPIEGSEKDLVRVTVRRPGHTPTKMWVQYPSEDAAFGLNIRTASNSELSWAPFTETHPDAG